MANRSFLAAPLLGCFALPPPARAETPSFHLVLSDGDDQLNGRAHLVAEKVSQGFRKMGIEVTWSFDPSDPSLPDENVVNVIILPHAGESWGMTPGALAAVRRDYDSRARVFVFCRELERTLNLRDSRATRSILGPRSPGGRMVDGASRVIMHEILHFFLPGRPHDSKGLFRSHVNGNVLDRSSFEISAETQDALVGALLEGSMQDRPCRRTTSDFPEPGLYEGGGGPRVREDGRDGARSRLDGIGFDDRSATTSQVVHGPLDHSGRQSLPRTLGDRNGGGPGL